MAKVELDVAEMVEETFEKHFGVTIDRLRELAEADKDGLIVVRKVRRPVDKLRPEHYDEYSEAGLFDGEVLYRRKHGIIENNIESYCPFCGERLCSRFENFCPNCGEKITREAAEKALEAMK